MAARAAANSSVRPVAGSECCMVPHANAIASSFHRARRPVAFARSQVCTIFSFVYIARSVGAGQLSPGERERRSELGIVGPYAR